MQRRRISPPTAAERIVAVIAPLGYGKTTLAAQWFEACRSEAQAYWFTLDAAWRDPVFFVDSLVQAITGTACSSGNAQLDGVAEMEGRLSVALEAMRKSSRVMLFFDDIHAISGADSCSVLSRLLLAAPPNVGFVLTGRDAAGFGLSPLAMRGEVRWVSGRQLVLSPQDVRDLAHGRRIRLSDQALQRIVEMTEGWPAMVQLALCGAGAGLQGTAQARDRNPLVEDFIYESFLGSLPPVQRAALAVMAALQDFTPALLDALGCQEPAQAIASCEQLGLVQHRSPSGGQPVLSLHPLVREEELRLQHQVDAQGIRELRRRASCWWRQAGDMDRAIAMALLAGDGQMALDCLRDYAPVLVQREGRHETFLGLLEQIRQRVAQVDPQIELHAIWSLIFLRRYPLAEEALQRTAFRLEQSHAPHDRTLEEALLLPRSVMAGLRDDHVLAGRYAQQWLGRSDDADSYRRGTAHAVLAFSQKCACRFQEARASLAQARTQFEAAHSSYGIAWTWVLSALTLMKAGQHRAALAEASAALAEVGHQANGLVGLAAMLHAARAQILYERDQLAEAQADVEAALPLLEHQGIVDPMIAGYITAARLQAVRGDISGALDALEEGERIGAARGFERLRLTLVAERALQLLRAGNLWGAQQLVQQHDLLNSGDGGGVQRDKAERFGARYQLAQGDADSARELIRRGVARARSSGQLYKLAELLMLQALAAQRPGGSPQADAALYESLDIAAAQGYVRLYLDEGTQAIDLLRQLVANPAAPEASRRHARHVVGRLSVSQQPAGPVGGIAEPLTEREQQILRMIPEGYSNAELAARIFLTEGTVKWHLHNLYRKLNVSNRTGAMREARSRGLLQA